uniref:Uncharacterized protein n=1 Tax=Glycine max TaxID=3847 RepID=K7MRL5_SOYBN
MLSLGYWLCFLNLVFDGFTNATHDSLKARYPNTSAWNAVCFCKKHPDATWDIFLYCCCGAIGQNFVFLTINRFGSLVNTTITTTCKFWESPINKSRQWGCVLMVFSGLSYQIYLKWQKLQRLQRKAM